MAAAAHLKVQPHPTTTRHRRRCPTQAPLPPPSPPPPPPHFSKFNSALNAGILNPMSPTPQTPPQTPPPGKLTRSSPTLFEMMAKEHDCTQNGIVSDAKPQVDMVPYKEFMMQERVFEILETLGSGSQFNDEETSDVRLTLVSKDGFSVRLNMHRRVLVSHSRVLAGKLSGSEAPPYTVEVVDCEDIEAYIEGLSLMYCEDLRRWLMKEDVHKVLGILKVSAAIGFDAGILSCLEYLEAAPWEEDEEEKVASLLLELQLEGVGVDEVLKRVSLDVGSAAEESGNDSEEVLIKLLLVILEGKDEKARREMKALVSKLLRENANRIDIRKESLYSACDGCLLQLRRHFLKAAASDLQDVGQIARQADNLFWILDILIDRNVAEDFMKTWASESEMSNAHSKVAPIHRFEVSGITAKLFVGIGKGQILASKDDRCLLLQTWLVPFYDDFGWMKRASKGLDRHVIEEGLTNTILTLPLAMQQDILLAWFDRFLNSQEECPNIQRGFEIWWRRAFWNRSGHLSEKPHVQIANGASENL